jgi:hypothetical protein
MKIHNSEHFLRFNVREFITIIYYLVTFEK